MGHMRYTLLFLTLNTKHEILTLLKKRISAQQNISMQDTGTPEHQDCPW
jgi:hypothetical protein